MKYKIKSNGKALIPFIIFIGMYLFTGFYLTYSGEKLAFYKVNSPIFVILGIISAFIPVSYTHLTLPTNREV